MPSIKVGMFNVLLVAVVTDVLSVILKHKN